MSIRATLKRLRQSQPLNAIITSAARRVLAIDGRRRDFFVGHLPRVGRIEIALPNGTTLRLWSEGDDWISNQLFWRGWDGYEREVVRVFYALAKVSRVTLDVGAFVGTYSLLAALANPGSQVFAFEPVPENYTRLRTNAGLNVIPRFESVCAAAGEVHGGETDLYLVDAGGLHVSCSTSETFMRYPDGVDKPASDQPLRCVRVPSVTIDGFVRERRLTSVDVVKIDTESTEPHVLRGMRETLERHRPHLIVEVLGHTRTEDELTSLLRPYGYSFFHLVPEGPVRRPSIRPQPPWDNYLVTTLPEAEVTRLWTSASFEQRRTRR